MRPAALASVAFAGALGCTAQSIDLYVPTDNLDLLFVVDDSPGTRSLQQRLVRNFPQLMTTLRTLPGGLPGLHVAVVSSDLGAGDGSIVGCSANGGQNGVFQHTARGACASSGLDPGATFISDVRGARNYQGSLEAAFECLAPLGESGCGFEHPLAAAARALGADGRPPPPENAGFLRPGAFLMIVIVSNEDDCSAPAGSRLFDTKANTTLDSELGPLGDYRCNEFGHLCKGKRPPRTPPSGSAFEVVSLNDCVSAEGAGMLIPVSAIADQIRSVKPYPDEQIVVAALTGPRTPYLVRWAPSPQGGPMPYVPAACTGRDGGSASPSIRIPQFVESFGADGRLLSVCADDFAPTMQRIADRLIAARRAAP